jgi:hypothetical protein
MRRVALVRIPAGARIVEMHTLIARASFSFPVIIYALQIRWPFLAATPPAYWNPPATLIGRRQESSGERREMDDEGVQYSHLEWNVV